MTCECKDWGSDGYCRRCGKHFHDRLNELESLARDYDEWIGNLSDEDDFSKLFVDAYPERRELVESLRTQDTEG